MHVTLCQPPSTYLLGGRSMPPLGILYLAAWLRKSGHDAEILDLAGIDDWKAEISRRQLNCDWFGISCTTPQYADAKRIRQYLRQIGYTFPIIVGGIHLTSLVKNAKEVEFLQKDKFDSYVIGEGYNAVTKICTDLQEGHVSPIYSESILKDVNDLPFAARDLIDIHSYKYTLGDVPTTTHYTQYGCPYACQYCESPLSGSFTVRAMNPERVAAEVKQVRDDFGIHGSMFFDDEMNLDKKRMLGICEKIAKLEDITWRGFVVTAKFDKDIAEACKRSGCYEIASGIESGSPTILKNIRKPATVDINRRFIRTAKQAGLRVKGFFIIGLPGESWSTVRETDRFLESLKQEGNPLDDLDCSILQVYKGAPIYLNPLDIEFNRDWEEKAYYKSEPGVYENLVQVRTAAMSKYDLIAARNYLESKNKKYGWTKQYSDRKDLDDIYQREDVAESIKYAENRLQNG